MLKLFRYLKPYRLPVALVLLLVFFQSMSELYLPTLMADIVDEGVIRNDMKHIWLIGGLMLLVTLLGAAFSIAASFLSSRVAAGFGKDVRSNIFHRVEQFSLQEFDKIGTASLITRTTNDVTQVQMVLMMMMRMMVMAPLMCVGGVVMAVSKDAKLSLVLVVVVPILALAVYGIASRGVPLFKVIQVKIDKLNLVLRESLTGIRVIRSFNRSSHEAKRFDQANNDLTETSIKVNKIMALMMPVMMLIMNFASIAIIWFGGLRVGDGHMMPGDLMAFLQYAMQIMFSLVMVSMMFVMIPRAAASAARINEVLLMKPTIVDKDKTTAPDSRRGFIEFDNVSFHYPGAEMAAVDQLTFRAGPGEVTAIIGGTGSGKSTLLNLIPRFYDPTSGHIRIDGVDVRDMSHQQLREQIGYVPQKAILFTGTIADNIRFGREDATDEQIAHAASIAQAADFIAAMPDGYASPISQGGTNVSGGQKQRLSIARALVRQPLIYLFDDSFSALDFKTDANLRAALRNETEEATVLIVAQRVSTVMDADRILVMEDGRIVAMGTHQELMQTSPVYQEIVSSQLSEEEIA